MAEKSEELLETIETPDEEKKEPEAGDVEMEGEGGSESVPEKSDSGCGTSRAADEESSLRTSLDVTGIETRRKSDCGTSSGIDEQSSRSSSLDAPSIEARRKSESAVDESSPRISLDVPEARVRRKSDSGIGGRKESGTELPPITERPELSASSATKGASSSEKSDRAVQSPMKSSLISKAKGLAARSMQTVSRTLSPKKDSQVGSQSTAENEEIQTAASPETAPLKEKSLKTPIKSHPADSESKEQTHPATAKGTMPKGFKALSPQSVWSKVKKSLTPSKKKSEEDETMLADEDIQPPTGGDYLETEQEMDQEATGQEPMEVDQPTAGEESAEGGSGAKPVTAKEKRSRFAGIISRTKTFSKSIVKSDKTSQEMSCSSETTDSTLIETPKDKVPPAAEEEVVEETKEYFQDRVSSGTNSEMEKDDRESLFDYGPL